MALFTLKHIRGDIFGGLTAGIVALPLALAFGEQSGLGASAGLYGAAFIAFFAALFGGTSTQISGPTAPMTVLSATLVGSILAAHEGNVEAALPIVLLVFALAGVFQITLGVLKLGTYIKYIPQTVVSGFMTGIGVIILITQMLPALGYYASTDESAVRTNLIRAETSLVDQHLLNAAPDENATLEDFTKAAVEAAQLTEEQIYEEAQILTRSESKTVVGSLSYLPRAVRNINMIEILLCIGTILIIYGFRRITKVVPSTLVALIAVTCIAYFGKLDYQKISAIEAGLPIPDFGIFRGSNIVNIAPYIFDAFILSLLGAIDSLLTSVVADNMTKTRHNPNKELIGQGIGNSIAAVFQGIPGAGATIRTVVNIQSGGRTRISGMLSGVLLFLIMMVLGPIASHIPNAVLAGILITVGIGVMDWKGLRALPYMTRTGVIIMITVLTLTVFWNLVYAVGIGLVISAFIFMKRMGDWSASRYGLTTLPKDQGKEIVNKHVHGPLFFGNARAFSELREMVPASAHTVILHMSEVPYVDQTGLYALEDALLDYANNDTEVIIVGLQEQVRLRMESLRMIPDLVSEDRLVGDLDGVAGVI